MQGICARRLVLESTSVGIKNSMVLLKFDKSAQGED